MSVNKDIKLQIRAAYESNNYSVAKIFDRFEGQGISKKTIESWVTKEKWQKNRFEKESEAISKLVDEIVSLEEVKDILSGKLEIDEAIEGEIIDRQYVAIVGKELVYKVLNAHSLQEKMAQNLGRAENFAREARQIGTLATYHRMLIDTYQTVHGKQINLAPVDPSKSNLSDDDVKKLSDEELEKLIQIKG